MMELDESSSMSVCALHPGVAVTGFCPACLRDRLAGLHPPPSSADLRRCKSFSYYGSSSSFLHLQEAEPHRRSSCDARQHPPPPEDIVKEHITRQQQQESSSSAAATTTTTKGKAPPFGALGKRWQEWRRKSKHKTKQQHHHQEEESPAARPTTRPPELGRRSCDVFSSRSRSINMNMVLGMMDDVEPRASCDGHRLPPPPPQMVFVPRSDDQIPVEEEEELEEESVVMPGGSAQTRDYYLDSSSSSRRRRSVDRKSFSSLDGADLLPPRMAANARVSPALVTGAGEFYHPQQQQHAYQQYHHHHPSSFEPPPLPLPLEATTKSKATKNKGIKGWSIWGLLHKKTSNSNNASVFGGGEARAAAPELRARGYDGQMLRCNSSVSARSSFSGINGAGLGLGLGGRMRRADEVLLERNFSARYSASCRMTAHSQPQFHHNSIANNSGGGGARSSASSLPRSSLGLYYY